MSLINQEITYIASTNIGASCVLYEFSVSPSSGVFVTPGNATLNSSTNTNNTLKLTFKVAGTYTVSVTAKSSCSTAPNFQASVVELVGATPANCDPISPVTPINNIVTLGAIRWDNYRNNEIQTTVPLNDSKWRHRAPYYAQDVPEYNLDYYGTPYPVTIAINGNLQSVEDQNIEYAFEANLDYFAFVYYGENEAQLNYGRKLYRSSTNPKKSSVNYSYMVEYFGDSHPNSRLNDFLNNSMSHLGDSNYFRVMGGRPLIYLLGYNDSPNGMPTPTIINNIKARYQQLFPNALLPYIVMMNITTDAGTAKTLMPAQGDAISDYQASVIWTGDHNYLSTADNYIAQNLTYRSNYGAKSIPTVATGLDPRPIYEFQNVNPYYAGGTGGGASLYANQATDLEFKNQVQKTIDFVKANLTTCEAKSVLIYAWNEHTEGGFVSPTLIPNSGGLINKGKVTALSQVNK